jgi:LPXTG-motif cell wall-anchored protein
VTYDEGDPSDAGSDYGTIGLVLSGVALAVALIAILMVIKKKRA